MLYILCPCGKIAAAPTDDMLLLWWQAHRASCYQAREYEPDWTPMIRLTSDFVLMPR